MVETEFKKKCPICNQIIFYINKARLNTSIKLNCLCKKCSYKKRKENPSEKVKKVWFKVGDRPKNADFRKGKTLEDIFGVELAIKLKNEHRNRKPSIESRIKRSITCKSSGCGLSNKGRKCSDENKIKFRKLMIEKLNNVIPNFHPPYNKKACEYFDRIMLENNVVIQHALNGGEYHIKELGYWLDGYDIKNNIVYEFDERFHFEINGKLREKDVIRQKEIENFLNCKFIRIKECDI